MEQKNYTLKECRAFNQKKLESTTAFIKGNFVNGECKELILPDEAHPWNILHAVTEQYYRRECERARTISIASCDLKIVQKTMNSNVDDLVKACVGLQKGIDNLRQENERLKAELSQLNNEQQKQPNALQELLQLDMVSSWIERLDNVQGNLITALGYDTNGQEIGSNLYTVRTLQKFFMELDKEMN